MLRFLTEAAIVLGILFLSMSVSSALFPRPLEEVIAFQEECISEGGKFSKLPFETLMCDHNK